MDRGELKYKRYFLCGISLHLAGIQRIIETVVDMKLREVVIIDWELNTCQQNQFGDFQ